MDSISALLVTGALLIVALVLVWVVGKRKKETKTFKAMRSLFQEEKIDENPGREGMNPVHFSEVQTKGHLETTRRMERTVYRK